MSSLFNVEQCLPLIMFDGCYGQMQMTQVMCKHVMGKAKQHSNDKYFNKLFVLICLLVGWSAALGQDEICPRLLDVFP